MVNFYIFDYDYELLENKVFKVLDLQRMNVTTQNDLENPDTSNAKVDETYRNFEYVQIKRSLYHSIDGREQL